MGSDRDHEDGQDLGEAFVDSLLEVGLLRRADLEDCVETSKLRSSKDKPLSVTDVLLEKGFLTSYQFKKLLKRVENHSLICHHCKAKIVVAKSDYDGKVRCKACKKDISLEEGTASVGDALVIDHPRRLADRLLAKLLVSEGLLDKLKVKKYMGKASESFPKRPLDSWLVDQGKIEPEDIRPMRKKRDKLLEKRYPFLARMQEDVELGRFLVTVGLVSLNRLNECLVAQAEKAKDGEYTTLRDLLHEAGELTEYQLEVFLPRHFDRISKRTEVLHRSPDDEADASRELLDSEVELIEEMKEKSGLVTLELEEEKEEDKAYIEKKKKIETYDKTNLDPGNLLRAYIEKTYGTKQSKGK